MARRGESGFQGDSPLVRHTGARRFGWLDYYIAPQTEEGVYLTANGAHAILPGEIFFPHRRGAGDLMAFRRGGVLECRVGAGGVRDLQDDCWGGNGVLKAKIALPRRMARFAAAAFEEGISLPEALSRWARPALARAIERAVPAGRREAERYAIEEAQGLLMENGLELVEFRLICLERGS